MICLKPTDHGMFFLLLGLLLFLLGASSDVSFAVQPSFDQGFIESLEDEPADENLDSEENWHVLYFKAVYHHYYRLKLNITNDTYSLPFNFEQRDRVVETKISNVYGSDSKIHLTDNFFSYIRFDYSFIQEYDHYIGEYRDTPDVDLYEAFLDYHHDNVRLQIGGLIMKLGTIDFDSPIDVLNLKNMDKVNHLDDTDNKYVMPTVKYNKTSENNDWTFYWAPFQRVSEEKQSLRANMGIYYKIFSHSMDIGFSFFNWFDTDNHISLEVDQNADASEDTLIPILSDTTIQFMTVDLDITMVNSVLKVDFGYFFKKNFYHIALLESEDSTTDVIEFKTLELTHAAFAVSWERKFDRLFVMPVYSYRRVFSVPTDTHIYQYENLSQSSSKKRDLERHQISTYLLYDWKDNLTFSFLTFFSFPFQRFGIMGKMIWKPLGDKSEWTLLLSHVETEENKMTRHPTSLNRIQYGYSLQF